MAIEIDRGHEKYDVVFGRAVIKAHAVANDYGCAEITWHIPGGATTQNKKRAMHFAQEINNMMNTKGL